MHIGFLDLMIACYLTDRITHVTGGLDKWNEPINVTETVIRAMVEWSVKKVTDSGGDEVVASGAVYVESKPDMTDKFKIDGIEHTIISINEVKAFSVSHYKVYIR